MKDKIRKAFEESIQVKEKFIDEKNVDKILENFNCGLHSAGPFLARFGF